MVKATIRKGGPDLSYFQCLTDYRQTLPLAEPRRTLPFVAHCHLGLAKFHRHTGKREQVLRAPQHRDRAVPRDGHAHFAYCESSEA